MIFINYNLFSDLCKVILFYVAQACYAACNYKHHPKALCKSPEMVGRSSDLLVKGTHYNIAYLDLLFHLVQWFGLQDSQLTGWFQVGMRRKPKFGFDSVFKKQNHPKI